MKFLLLYNFTRNVNPFGIFDSQFLDFLNNFNIFNFIKIKTL